MVHPAEAKSEGPQMLNVLSFRTANDHGNSKRIPPHPYAYPSNNILDPGGQTSLPIPDVLLTLYHDVPV